MSRNTELKSKAREPYRQTALSKRGGWLAFIDQEADGTYSGVNVVRKVPKTWRDRYWRIKSPYTGKVDIRSYRRDKSHRQIVILSAKKGGARKENISHILGLALDLDGKRGGTRKTIYDIYIFCENNQFPLPTYIIETSPGHFHLIWLFDHPLPWTEKITRWRESQVLRLIQLFDDFGPDVKACVNPVQFYRNWSQENPYNHKRGCDVTIHRTRVRTSLSAMQAALDAYGIPNVYIRRDTAEVVLRRYLRSHEYIHDTSYEKLAKRLGFSARTLKRLIPKLVEAGDLEVVERRGNNKGETRRTSYHSLIYLQPIIESEADLGADSPIFSEGTPLSDFKSKSAHGRLYAAWQRGDVGVGYRNKALFALALWLKCWSGGVLGLPELRDRLELGRLRCGTPEDEFTSTLKSALKHKYSQPLTRKKLREQGLLGFAEVKNA